MLVETSGFAWRVFHDGIRLLRELTGLLAVTVGSAVWFVLRVEGGWNVWLVVWWSLGLIPSVVKGGAVV